MICHLIMPRMGQDGLLNKRMFCRRGVEVVTFAQYFIITFALFHSDGAGPPLIEVQLREI